MRHLAARRAPELGIEVSSAGLEAHGLNPGAVKAMAKQGIDISGHLSEVLTDEMVERADLIITVCAHADANCPLVPAHKEKRHMPFTDPASATGTEGEIADCFSQVCQEIGESMNALIEELRTGAN